MMKNYIREKKAIGSYISLLWKKWPVTASVLAFTLLVCFTGRKFTDETLKEINTAVLTASSILSAIIITFLVGKVIQVRQEKLANWNEFHELTQKVHHFRAALVPLYQSWDFWPNGLKYRMKNRFASLTYYGVRKSVYVHGTKLSPLEQEFIDNHGGLHNFYLQLRALLPHGISDGTLYTKEFDVAYYYEVQQLELWYEFECAANFSNYFTNEYLPLLSFNAITTNDRNEVMEHCKKIDAKRYDGVPFGDGLYELLSQQFSQDLLPRLYRLSLIVEGPLSTPVRVLGWILPCMIMVGIISPFLILMQWLPADNTIFSAAAILSLLFYLGLTFHQTIAEEASVRHKLNR